MQFFSSDLIALALRGGDVEHQGHMVFVPALVISVPSPPQKMHNSPGLRGGGKVSGASHKQQHWRGCFIPHLNSATYKKAAAVYKESVLKVNNALTVNNAV